MKNMVLQYIQDYFSVIPEYLWIKYPTNAVLRRTDNKKWFGIVMDIPKNKLGLQGEDIAEILVVKCDPFLIGSLCMREGFLPAYHMNKNNWITILLDGSVEPDEIKKYLELSYELAGSKKKGKL